MRDITHGLVAWSDESLEPAMTEPAKAVFDLEDFLPYLLNQAAEAASRGFQEIYRDSYAMTRTQWRVMANLGKFGAMTARDICAISHIEKTKVSRAVATLEREGLLARRPSEQDRRAEVLSLTDKGLAAFADLGQRAVDYDRSLRQHLGPKASTDLDEILRAAIAMRSAAAGDED
jgi:DNA-binding MarR family transcriptional regulator